MLMSQIQPSIRVCAVTGKRNGFLLRSFKRSFNASLACEKLGPNSHLRSRSVISPVNITRIGRHGRRDHLTAFCSKWGPLWTEEKSPYEVLGLDPGSTEDEIKSGYRKMAKIYHPDVYDGTAELSDGESAESRFIQIQAAYEFLSDEEVRRKYDYDHKRNPMHASQAWNEWVMKKKKAFNQRGDLAASSWSESMQREANIRARNLSRSKVDPGEEKRLLEKEKLASAQHFNTTMKRHYLVLKKRDLERSRSSKKSQKQLVQELLALEGFELEDEDEEEIDGRKSIGS